MDRRPAGNLLAQAQCDCVVLLVGRRPRFYCQKLLKVGGGHVVSLQSTVLLLRKVCILSVCCDEI